MAHAIKQHFPIFFNLSGQINVVRSVYHLQRVPAVARQQTTINRLGNGLFVRNSTFKSSEILSEDQMQKISTKKIEILTNSEQWKFVERLISTKVVNQSPDSINDEPLPSGWKPQKSLQYLKKNYSYYVSRTKNHQIPCYLMSTFRGNRKVTKLRRIEGDIWALEKDLRAVLEKTSNQKIESRVNEMSGQLDFKGAHVSTITDILMEKGF